MTNPIPSFDHNLVLPPYLGNPTDRSQLSPYPCTTVDLCQRLGTTPDRRKILEKFFDFRARLHNQGLVTGFQWLDGSFLEDIETRARRSPRDLDVVTVYWGYDMQFQEELMAAIPEFVDPSMAKQNYCLDHYPFCADFRPEVTLDSTRYWILLFSHNRLGVWKGMLKIALNTPQEDAAARQALASL